MTFQLSGANSGKPTKFAPIWSAYWSQGLVTQRNPLRQNQSFASSKYYGAYDALIDGSNIEISNRLTPVRRPGNSVYNSQSFTNVDYFYPFHLFSTTDETIKVIVDTAAALYDGTGPSTKSLIWTKSAGAGQTIPLGVGNNLYFGNGVDQKKWVQTLETWEANTAYSVSDLEDFIIDSNGNIQQVTATIVPISTVQVSADVLTITRSGTTDLTTVLSTGLEVTFPSGMAATFLDGQTVTLTGVTSSTFTADFNHADYGPTAETSKVATVVSGGNPITGASQPTWATSLLATTNDNTVQWTMRSVSSGSQIMNWGIAAPTTAPDVSVGASNVSWQKNTFYSNDQVIVDSNGNLQQVTTKGTSGATAPTWATIDGHTTADGPSLVWTQLETAAELTWAANTTYSLGHILLTNAAGTDCLFKFQESTFPVFKLVTGQYAISTFYDHNHSFNGQCELRNPADGTNNPGSGSYPLLATANGTSCLFNPPQFNGTPDPHVNPIEWAALNAAGDITGYAVPWVGATTQYNMIVTFTLTMPAAGQYTFTINHDDGMFWGMGGGATRVSGATNCPAPNATLTPINGYPVMGANNVSGNNPNDVYTVNCPTAGDYPVEIAFCNWETAQQLVFYCNGQTPVPGAPETGATQPIWPAWTTAFAPAYPTVSERNNSAPSGGTGNGPLAWTNIGPAADYVWRANTQFLTTSGSTIIDPVNNTEDPYEAGATGTTQPIFATGINQLTNDNPNLIWINQGPASAPPAGTLSTYSTQGWIYYIALVNTLTDTVSNAGPASAQTGPFIGATSVHVSGGLPDNIDPQVDYVAIFRTKDGGATPFLIPGSGNTVFTISLADYMANGYDDTTQDSGLNILLQAPVEGENTPPSIGATNLVLHLGRIFFSIGNVVYWTAGPDTPIGNGFEGVPPLNNANFTSLVKHMVPTSTGLQVYTVSDIDAITGNGTPQSPLFPIPYLPGKGISSYNDLTTNGTLSYIFATSNSVMVVDQNGGYYDLGFPIGDQFKKNNWKTSSAYLTWHEYGEDVALFVADGTTGWFRGNPTPSPENGETWSPFATVVGGVKAIGSIEVTPGVKKLLLGSTGTGPILMRDLSVNSDNGVSYPAYLTMGSIVLAQPGQLAEVAFITTDSVATGTTPSISVLLDEISGAFDPLDNPVADPPELEPSKTTYAQRFYLMTGDNPPLCRHMQIKISYPAEDKSNEMLSCTIFGGYHQER